jgi:hypothetical protein
LIDERLRDPVSNDLIQNPGVVENLQLPLIIQPGGLQTARKKRFAALYDGIYGRFSHQIVLNSP